MEKRSVYCETAIKMLLQGTSLQELINHMDNCCQCKQLLPFIKKELEKLLGMDSG